MAITAYTGLPGAGKSYEVVNGPILRAVAKRRRVWTNIEVSEELRAQGVYVVPPEASTQPDHPERWWMLQAPPGTLIVIDEPWRYWPAGAMTNMIPEEQREFFAMHRHKTDGTWSTDIVLATQDLSQLASFIRMLVERTYRMRKLTGIGLRNWYRVDLYEGAVTGHRPPAHQHVGGWRTRYNKDGFAHYKSQTLGDGQGKEEFVDKRGSVWTRPSVLAIPAMAIFFFWLYGYVNAKVLPEPEEPAPELVAQAPAPEPAPPPSPRSHAQPEPPPAPPSELNARESGAWNLVGYIEREDGTGIAYIQHTFGSRILKLEDHCEHDGWQMVCRLDGQVVATWTGGGGLRRTQGTSYSRP
jgi:zona occludens toxin